MSGTAGGLLSDIASLSEILLATEKQEKLADQDNKK